MTFGDTEVESCKEKASVINKIFIRDGISRIGSRYEAGKIEIFCCEPDPDPGFIIDNIYDLLRELHPGFEKPGNSGLLTLVAVGPDLHVIWNGKEVWSRNELDFWV